MEDGIAPTDTRNRPDQRFMEEGEWDKANEEKVQTEHLNLAAVNPECNLTIS